MTQQLLNEEELLIRNTVRDFSNTQLASMAAQLDKTEAVSYTHLTLPTKA